MAWVPLALLTLVFAEPDARMAFLIDAATHSRFLLAVPIFILADYIVLPRLDSMARHFGDSNLVPPDPFIREMQQWERFIENYRDRCVSVVNTPLATRGSLRDSSRSSIVPFRRGTESHPCFAPSPHNNVDMCRSRRSPMVHII